MICLIQLSNHKVIPALCLTGPNDHYLFAQIRKANKEEIALASLDSEQKRNKPKNGQRKKNTVYIGKPKGLMWEAVAMTDRLHRVKNREIRKELTEVSGYVVGKCLNQTAEGKRTNELQKELHALKRKIHFAEINNEKCQDYMKQVASILNELGYRKNKNHSKQPKAYENYRVAPDKGWIKIHLGGR